MKNKFSNEIDQKHHFARVADEKHPHSHAGESGVDIEDPPIIKPGVKIDLGGIIRKRVVIFPALEKEPKRELPSWGVFPPFTITDEQLAENLEYRYPASLTSASPAELSAMTDRTINAGKEPIDAGDFELWLYATSISPAMRVKGKQLYEIRITFVFRARRIIFAPAESASGSIVEIPKEPSPEDLEKKEPKEEVKNG